jgi:hypothetical protein
LRRDVNNYKYAANLLSRAKPNSPTFV